MRKTTKPEVEDPANLLDLHVDEATVGPTVAFVASEVLIPVSVIRRSRSSSYQQGRWV